MVRKPHLLRKNTERNLKQKITGRDHRIDLAGIPRQISKDCACEAQKAPTTNVLHLEDHPTKSFHREIELITFIEEDANKVHSPHNDHLVLTIQISNMLVH
ncbi:hypothetical protein TorRG33x02_321910 [Trema orientale]|uniref:Uncharacterized protein n=1 Tax=Trema orientale TaxID=63057 RepID=A0A2P5BGJ6_TREOI|nr:hypothetical protein TorRG33x02_321910 [Trema orientale]